METVGVIGLGLMGSAIAERLLGGGRRVIGFDPRIECRERLAALGGTAGSSARDVWESTRVILLSLPNSDVVSEVLNEAREWLPGATIIDTTTGSPEPTAAIGERLAALGADYLDATLTGSSAVARAGQLIVTAGGTADTFARAEPLFRLFAKQSFHVGTWGSGAKTKLVVNLVLGLNRAVLAEGLSFARKCGLEPNAILEVLRSGAAYSRAMDAKGRKMIDGEFAAEAKLAQHLKDVRLILAEGLQADASLPLSSLHEKLLSELVNRGFGELDNSAVIHAFDRPGGQS